jgi:phage FluMu protein Com
LLGQIDAPERPNHLSVASALRFQATCPRCGQLAWFLAAKVEKSVLTQGEVAEGARPGYRGFRCLLCRKIVAETDDVEGFEHRWVGNEPVTYPIRTGTLG